MSRRILFADIGTKTLSLILALAVYIHVFSGREREMSYRVPLEILPLPTGLTIAGGFPPEIRVRVRASGKDLLKLKTRPFHAEIAVDSPHPGALQRPILPSDLRLPRGVRVSSVEILDPRTLNLSIEKLGSSAFPIAVRIQEVPGEDRALLERPYAIPRTVHLTGPASMLEAIDSAQTEPISIGKGGEREAAIAPPSGLTADPKMVTVHLRTDEKRSRRYTGVEVDSSPLQGGRLLWIQPTEVDVIVTGAASIVDAISLTQVRVFGDLGPLSPGAHRIHLRAVLSGLPRGALVRSACVPDSASVRLQ